MRTLLQSHGKRLKLTLFSFLFSPLHMGKISGIASHHKIAHFQLHFLSLSLPFTFTSFAHVQGVEDTPFSVVILKSFLFSLARIGGKGGRIRAFTRGGYSEI